MAVIQRAGTFTAKIRTPLAPSEYSQIRVSFAQGQRIVVEKTIGDAGFTVGTDSVELVLTQAETLQFAPTAGSPMGTVKGPMAFMQIRCYKNATDAPASCVWPLPVYDSLNQEVMGT